MRVRFDFHTEAVYQTRDLLNYRVGRVSTITSYSSIGLFMCKPMDIETQREFAVLTRRSSGVFMSKNSSTYSSYVEFGTEQAVADVFMKDVSNNPLIIDFYSVTTMNKICSSFEKLMRYKSYDIDFMFGIYNCRSIYRNGRYYDVLNYFDSMCDFKDKYPIQESRMSLKSVCDYLKYAIRVRPGKIDVYSGDDAKKEFRKFHKEYYADRNKDFKRQIFGFDSEMVDELDNVQMCKVSKEKPLFIEGKDFLKVVLPDDKMVIVFNTNVPDEVWTVSTFKKYLLQAFTEKSNKVLLSASKSIEAIFMTRKFDMDFTDLSQLLFVEKETGRSMKDNYYYEMIAQTYSDELGWMPSGNCFQEEFDTFLSIVKSDKYTQSNQHSFESLVYKDVFSFGSGNECGYFVYTY